MIQLAIATLAVLLLAQPAQPPVVRTADPAARGFSDRDFPRTQKIADNVYTYEDFHAGTEKFTTTNMFVVTAEGVLVADGQGSAEATRHLVNAIARVTGPVSREELANYRRAVQAVIAEASRLHNAGVPVDAALERADFGEYAGWTLSRSQGPIAIRRVYDELDGRLK